MSNFTRSMSKYNHKKTHLFYRELFEFRQRAGQQPHQEGGGTADDVQHGGRQHGDEGVLPGERVQQRHDGEHAAGQRAEDGRQNKTSQFKAFFQKFSKIRISD